MWNRIFILLIGLSGYSAASVADMEQWTWHATADGAHPDQYEQHLMWLMNRARQNPAAEGRWLADTDHPEIALPREQYDVSLRRLKRHFRKIPPRQPAGFDARLYIPAYRHSEKMIRKDRQTHRGQLKAVLKVKQPWKECHGSVFAYATSSLNAHAAFNIDWGRGWGGTQRGAGHRHALMSTNRQLSVVGIAGIAENDPDTKAGPWVVTANYCELRPGAPTELRQMLVGTVYADLNNNRRFDPGEGIPGVRVAPDHGRYFVVTAAGGGYTVPLTKRGKLSIRMSGAGIRSVSYGVVAQGHNILLDHVAEDHEEHSRQ